MTRYEDLTQALGPDEEGRYDCETEAEMTSNFGVQLLERLLVVSVSNVGPEQAFLAGVFCRFPQFPGKYPNNTVCLKIGHDRLLPDHFCLVLLFTKHFTF
jgi:hypothetical protein